MRTIFLLAALVPCTLSADSWPTYMHDNDRSGQSTEELKLPLHVQWTYQATKPPEPAWPKPAKQNFWANKFNLRARVIYDRAFHVVAADGAILFGTSSSDQVVCLDSKTGKTRWSFFTEGPVRLAPTISGKRVLFGSDDGHIYCLKIDDGTLLWRQLVGPRERRIPGNERIISPWPIRTGVLVTKKIAYVAAGIFPAQGVYQAAFSIESGKRLAIGPLAVSAQGYLSQRNGRLFIKTGRNPRGSLSRTRLQKASKQKATSKSKQPPKSLVVIGSKGCRFAGYQGKVAALDKNNKELWSAKVDGDAYSLAIADGQLLVSTDKGVIHSFAATKPATVLRNDKAIPKLAVDEKVESLAGSILKKSHIKRGYCLLVSKDPVNLAGALVRQSQLNLVALVESSAQAAKARTDLNRLGLYGSRVAIHDKSKWKGKLPYTSYLFNLVIVADERPDLSQELARVTRPVGGVRLVRKGNEWQRIQRGSLAGAGEWSHMYANAANTICSADELVAGRLQLQWFGRPGPRQMVDRHNRTIAPVSKNGRLFIPGNNRVIGVDAYNGTGLWNVPVKGFRRVGAYRDCSNLVAADKTVYVVSGDRCLALDAEYGTTSKTFRVPAKSKKKATKRHWGFLAVDGDQLFGSAAHPNATRTHHGKATIKQVYYDFGQVVGSQSLFAVNRKSGKTSWTYDSTNGLIVNPTISVGPVHVVFAESKNRNTHKQGRASLKNLLGKGSAIVALNRKTGKVAWRKPLDLSKTQHNLYLCIADGLVVIVGSRNAGKKKSAKVIYDIHVLHSADGRPNWKYTQQQNTRIGGSHGEQDHRQVVVGRTLICEPFAYDLHTGRRINDFKWRNRHRRGCGNIAASAKSLFFRDNTLTMFDLTTNRASPVSKSTRAGCWINMIPAGGLLLVPEASSGCTCNFSVQTSLAFIPVSSGGP